MKPHDICPNCKSRDMFYFPIEEANVNDGDGVPDYYTVDYWHCQNCNKYFDEDIDECQRPEQENLI